MISSRGDVRLVRLGHADLDEVVALANSTSPAPWSRESFLEELERDIAHLYGLRLVQGDALVAFITFWLVRDEVHVLNVATHTAYRRRGYARALLAETLIFAREERVSLVTLEVRASNVAAITLYTSLEFERIGTRPKYYADNDEDAVVMLLSLTPQAAP